MPFPGVLDFGIVFLQKPLTPDSLRHKVRKVLNPPNCRGPSESTIARNRCPTPRLPPAFGADGSCCSVSRS